VIALIKISFNLRIKNIIASIFNSLVHRDFRGSARIRNRAHRCHSCQHPDSTILYISIQTPAPDNPPPSVSRIDMSLYTSIPLPDGTYACGGRPMCPKIFKRQGDANNHAVRCEHRIASQGEVVKRFRDSAEHLLRMKRQRLQVA
jgi:hypothetical protein